MPSLTKLARDSRSVWFGVGCGFLTALVLVAAALTVKGIFPGTRNFQTRCGDASVHGTIWVQQSSVNVLIAISDPHRRKWVLTWKGYEDSAGPVVLDTDNSGFSNASVAVLTDTDDGTHRTALLRPYRESKTCELSMHASWLW